MREAELNRQRVVFTPQEAAHLPQDRPYAAYICHYDWAEGEHATLMHCHERLADDLKKEWIYISLDLNSLKHINDTYGHDVGDEMICAAAACMMASFGEFGKVYRIGGDEFVVIVTQKPDELDTMTKHFDSSVAEWRGKIVNSMTISYGCVRSLEEDWELVHDIEKEADRRMYASKARYYSDSGIDRRK